MTFTATANPASQTDGFKLMDRGVNIRSHFEIYNLTTASPTLYRGHGTVLDIEDQYEGIVQSADVHDAIQFRILEDVAGTTDWVSGDIYLMAFQYSDDEIDVQTASPTTATQEFTFQEDHPFGNLIGLSMTRDSATGRPQVRMGDTTVDSTGGDYFHGIQNRNGSTSADTDTKIDVGSDEATATDIVIQIWNAGVAAPCCIHGWVLEGTIDANTSRFAGMSITSEDIDTFGIGNYSSGADWSGGTLYLTMYNNSSTVTDSGDLNGSQSWDIGNTSPLMVICSEDIKPNGQNIFAQEGTDGTPNTADYSYNSQRDSTVNQLGNEVGHLFAAAFTSGDEPVPCFAYVAGITETFRPIYRSINFADVASNGTRFNTSISGANADSAVGTPNEVRLHRASGNWGAGVFAHSTKMNLSDPDAFTPADLFAASEDGAWYDPSDLSTLWKDTAGTDPVTADSDAVARIDDKSGNGFHMIQATAASRPLYKTSGGLHWLEFDGSDDLLAYSTGGLTWLASQKEFVCYAGMNTNVSNGVDQIFSTVTEGATVNDYGVLQYSDTRASPKRFGGVRGDGGEDSGDWDAELTHDVDHVIGFWRDGDVGYARLDGADNAATAAIDSTIGSEDGNDDLSLGARNVSTPNLHYGGRLYQFVVRDTLPTSQQEFDLENYIATKSGVTL
jgi:hypothetical protein